MTKLVNLTPHTITICDAEGTPVREIPSEGAARVASTLTAVEPVDGIPVVLTTWGAVEGLPDPADGVVYIVSTPVIAALPGRPDLLRPDAGPQNVVRDADGKVIGVKALTR